jgi:hypothetical protein
MDRRDFLRKMPLVLGLAAAGGGAVYARRYYHVHKLRDSLLAFAEPALTKLHFGQINTLPRQGAEEIRRYFHGRCLNVGNFVQQICGKPFRDRILACSTADQREQCFMLAFCEQVATPEEMNHQVQVIAEDLGKQIDTAWATYCTDVCRRWNGSLTQYGSMLRAEEFSHSVETRIRTEIDRACREAERSMILTSLGGTLVSVGKSALLVLPVFSFGTPGWLLGIPLFVVLAARDVWNYIASLFIDPKPGLQERVSAKLAQLGNRIASEFERQAREALADLHRWQHDAVRDQADKVARDRVGWI